MGTHLQGKERIPHQFPMNKEKEHRPWSVLFHLQSRQSDSAGDFARTEAMSAHVDMLGGAIDNRLHTLDVGLPGTVGAAVGVGNLNPEHNALVAKITFSHSLNLLAGL